MIFCANYVTKQLQIKQDCCSFNILSLKKKKVSFSVFNKSNCLTFIDIILYTKYLFNFNSYLDKSREKKKKTERWREFCSCSLSTFLSNFESADYRFNP